MLKPGTKTTIAGISFLLICVVVCMVYIALQSWKRESSSYHFQLSNIVLDSIVKRDSPSFDSFKEKTDSLFSSFIQTHQQSLHENKFSANSLDSLVQNSKQIYVSSFPGIDSLKLMTTNIGLDSTFDISLKFGFFRFNGQPYNSLNHQMDSFINSNNKLNQVFTSNAGLSAKDFIGSFHIRGNLFHFDFLYFLSPQNLSYSIFKRVWGEMLALLVIAILVIVFSIFMIKAVAEQKKFSDRKTDFINVITHEFNTPISTISIATKMLKDEKADEHSRVQHFVAVIERQNLLLKQIMQRLVNSSSGNRAMKNLIKLNVESELKKVVEDFKTFHQNEKFTLNVQSVLSDDIFILSDDALFSSTLLNILDNAVKYRKPDVILDILVSAFIDKNNVVITIKDNGIGIEPDEIPHIFKHFYRSQNNPAENKGGMGMGLYLVKENMRKMKGSVSVKSKSGEGSTFRLQFPISK